MPIVTEDFISSFQRMAKAQPALVAALKAYQTAADSWHGTHHNQTIVGCDLICAAIPAGKAAVALAGEPSATTEEDSNAG